MKILVVLIPLLILSCGKKTTEPSISILDAEYITLADSLPTDTIKAGSLNMTIGFRVQGLIFLNLTDSQVVYNETVKMYDEYLRSLPHERVKIMAQEIVTRELHIVGLQEVMTMAKNDTLHIDFLETLLAELKNLGAGDYQVYKSSLNDVVINVASNGEKLKVQFSEGNAILLRPGFTIHDSATLHFNNIVTVPFFGATATSQRSLNYMRVASPAGVSYQIYNTHLEVSPFSAQRKSQASQMMKLVDSLKMKGHTQILVADLNTVAGVDAHAIITQENFVDTYAAVKTTGGFTCCVSDLRDPTKGFSLAGRRIDYIMARQLGKVLDSYVFLNQPSVTAAGDTLFATDHGFVVSTLLTQ